MPYPVTYHCPRCGAVHELQREGYLADKTVTPYPIEGWTYADASGEFEAADGIRVVCGDDDLLVPDAALPAEFQAGAAVEEPDEAAPTSDDLGCGEPFYISFARFENGEEIEPPAAVDSETVDLAPEGPSQPRGPGGPGSRDE